MHYGRKRFSFILSYQRLSLPPRSAANGPSLHYYVNLKNVCLPSSFFFKPTMHTHWSAYTGISIFNTCRHRHLYGSKPSQSILCRLCNCYTRRNPIPHPQSVRVFVRKLNCIDDAHMAANGGMAWLLRFWDCMAISIPLVASSCVCVFCVSVLFECGLENQMMHIHIQQTRLLCHIRSHVATHLHWVRRMLRTSLPQQQQQRLRLISQVEKLADASTMKWKIDLNDSLIMVNSIQLGWVMYVVDVR